MISEQQFQQLCTLARLDPDDDSLKALIQDFNSILEYVNHIAELDVHDTELNGAVSVGGRAAETKETSTGAGPESLDMQDVFRPDQAVEIPGTDKIKQFAPEWESGHFVVPGVIESEG